MNHRVIYYYTVYIHAKNRKKIADCLRATHGLAEVHGSVERWPHTRDSTRKKISIVT